MSGDCAFSVETTIDAGQVGQRVAHQRDLEGAAAGAIERLAAGRGGDAAT